MNKFSRAVRLATIAHDGQTDHNKDPYILHPTRVASNVQYFHRQAERMGVSLDSARIIAVLHDVVEDTDYGLDEVSYALDLTITEHIALDAITHLPDEPYDEYIKRVVQDPLATVVKLADLKDNTDPDRTRRLRRTDSAKAHRLFNKYAKAVEDLGFDPVDLGTLW